jgi:hypothetical protein
VRSAGRTRVRPAVVVHFRTAGVVALLTIGLLSSTMACAARRLPVPSGGRTAAPDGLADWAVATRACRSVRAYSSTIRLSGRVNDDRIPSGLAIASGLDAEGRLRLEARMVGRRVFTIAGTRERSVLLLHRERQYVVERAGRILGALLGPELDPETLLAILTGCVTFEQEATEVSRLGDFLEVVTSRARLYLRPDGSRWLPRLAFTAGVQVDFTRFEGLWPSELRVWTEPGGEPAAALRLRIDTVQVNSFAFDERAFSVDVPDDAELVDLEALRRAVSRKGPAD